MKQTLFIITVILLLFGVIFLQQNKINNLKQPTYVTDTVTLVEIDTVALIKPILQKREIVKYDTLTLPSDTLLLYDTITDTVRIPVPLSEYVIDTIITTDSSKTHLRGVLEGFSVSVDSLSIEYEKTRQEVIKTPKKWSLSYGFVFGIGISKPF